MVVVISSMSAAHGSANGADGWLRRTVHRRMEREIARLEEAGIVVISLEPGAESRRAMGLRAMAEDRGPQVIEAAYEETRELILATARPGLAGRPARRRHRRLTPGAPDASGSRRAVRGDAREGRVDES